MKLNQTQTQPPPPHTHKHIRFLIPREPGNEMPTKTLLHEFFRTGLTHEDLSSKTRINDPSRTLTFQTFQGRVEVTRQTPCDAGRGFLYPAI